MKIELATVYGIFKHSIVCFINTLMDGLELLWLSDAVWLTLPNFTNVCMNECYKYYMTDLPNGFSERVHSELDRRTRADAKRRTPAVAPVDHAKLAELAALKDVLTIARALGPLALEHLGQKSIRSFIQRVCVRESGLFLGAKYTNVRFAEGRLLPAFPPDRTYLNADIVDAGLLKFAVNHELPL